MDFTVACFTWGYSLLVCSGLIFTCLLFDHVKGLCYCEVGCNIITIKLQTVIRNWYTRDPKVVACFTELLHRCETSVKDVFLAGKIPQLCLVLSL